MPVGGYLLVLSSCVGAGSGVFLIVEPIVKSFVGNRVFNALDSVIQSRDTRFELAQIFR
jgi:hypothetical protein